MEGNSLTVVGADEYAKFFAAENGAVLDAFADFNFSAAASWSQIELWATAAGVDVDLNFAKVIATAGVVFPAVSAAMTDAVRTTRFLDAVVNTDDFALSAYRIWTSAGRQSSHAYRFLTWYVDKHQNSNLSELFGRLHATKDLRMRMYELFGALDARFPALLLRFYAKEQHFLHGWDDGFCKWLISRMPGKIKAYPDCKAFADMHEEMLKASADSAARAAFLN